jgi:hypothetical protein
MFRRIRRKRSIAALSVVAVLALAGGAYAYFTSTGSGTGSVTVGSASPWTVNPNAATGTSLLPGSGTQTITYTVTNASQGNQKLSGTTAQVASSSGNVTSGGTAVPGCLASWFTVNNTSPAATDLAGGASTTGSLTVTMQDTPTINQNVCQTVTPDITISAS